MNVVRAQVLGGGWRLTVVAPMASRLLFAEAGGFLVVSVVRVSGVVAYLAADRT